MADGYWNRQRQQQQQQQQQQLHSSSPLLKRPRPEYDLPPADTETIGSAYDRYLQSGNLSSGEATGFNSGGISGMHPLHLLDQVAMTRAGLLGPDPAANGRPFPFDRHSPIDMMARPARDTLPLPPDASSTIYIEGLPAKCTRREVAHIFRPFVGYREVRLVSKDSKHRGGEPLVIGFVDFTSAACAATALCALQGYKMDEHDPGSAYLRLQFSKNPGARSGPTRRGGRR